MQTRNVAYWVTTGLVAASCIGGGLLDVLGSEHVVSSMRQLGYPAYVAPLLGVWKLLGAGALLVPGFGRLKEWAYAGLVFDLTGASLSHAMVGDPSDKVLTPLVLLVLTMISWVLRPESRKPAARTGSLAPSAPSRESAPLQPA